MAMMAVAFPILPGKTGEWRAFIAELDGTHRTEFVDSRERAGVRERTFLQPTPMGDLVIVTLEGDDPAHAFGQMMQDTSPFATWFREKVQAIHGVDLAAPVTASPSELVIDTAAPAVAR